MAKVPFTKLNTTKSIPSKEFDFNGQKIMVEQYLPLSAKLDLIQTVIELSGGEGEGFFNIVKLKTFYTIEMLKAYTNISITEKQQEDPQKLYDAIVMNNIWREVAVYIPEEEQAEVWDNILALAREATEYDHSALGILKTITSEDYANLQLDAESIRQKITDPEGLKLLKAILDKEV